MKSKVTKLTITASRTVQIVQYEPLSLTITEEHEVGEEFHKMNSRKKREYKRELTHELSKLLEKATQDAAEQYRD